MLNIVGFGDLWVNKVSVNFSRQWTSKLKLKCKYNNTYRFGNNGLIRHPTHGQHMML